MIRVRHLLESKKPALYTIGPDAPVLEAVRAMAAHGVGALLVMSGTTLRGIVSERDYARKVVLHGRASADTPVAQIMSSPVLTVPPEATVQHCMVLMTERRIRHLPVVEDGRVIGVVSIGDLVKSVIEDQQRTIEQLETYIRG
jgi:CBS domain-containing protein